MSTEAIAANEPNGTHSSRAEADLPLGCKRTAAGVIPTDWDVRPFGELALIERGKFTARPRDDPKYYGGSIPFIQTGDVTNSRGRITKYSQTLNSEGLKVSKLFPRGTLFFTIAANIGDVGVTTFDSACPDSLVAITPARRIDKAWLAYELSRRKASFENIATQNAQLNINLEKLRPYLIPVPTWPEQCAIAEALSDVDGLLWALEALIAKKWAIKQAAMQQLLTGKTRLPGFGKAVSRDDVVGLPSEWLVKPLSSVSVMHGRIGWQGLTQSEFTTAADDPFLITGVDFRDTGIDWETAYHVSRERYDVAPLIQLRPGDVLMTKDGTIGKMLYVTDIPYPGMATLNSHLLVFRPIDGSYVPRFLFYQMSSRRFSDHVEAHKSGSTFFGLSQAATGRFGVLLPPIDEQEAIANVLVEMDEELETLKRRLGKTKAIRQGMMQQLLTGRVRLVKPAPAEANA